MSAVGPQRQFPTVTSLFRQPLINIFVLIKQELGNEINYLVLSGESTGLVCPYGRGDAGGVMQGEVPFLAYFSYCAHYLVFHVQQLFHSAAENSPANAQSRGSHGMSKVVSLCPEQGGIEDDPRFV